MRYITAGLVWTAYKQVLFKDNIAIHYHLVGYQVV